MTDLDIRDHFEEIINTMNDGLVLVGSDGRIKLVNPALEDLTGYGPGELLGKPCSVLNCDGCERSRRKGGEHWCQLFEDKTIHRRRCHIMRKDGACLTVLKNASVFRENAHLLAVESITDITELVKKDRKIAELSRRLPTSPGFHGMIGKSEAMQRVFNTIQKAAQSDAPVIVFGESGTGKELAAQAVHEAGPRRDGPYIQVNCAALNESLFESELFGHVKGAFTGAIRHRQGRFEAAHGGDIFLDEIGDVPMSIQVKLLRVLEAKQIERVGDHKSIAVDARIITATNKDLRQLVQRGEFREDLLFRINVIPIYMPPLRARKNDIPLLAYEFLRDISGRADAPPAELSREAMDVMRRYTWPGNVRELKSALEFAAVVIDEDGVIKPEHLPETLLQPEPVGPPSGPRPHGDDEHPLLHNGDPPEKRQLIKVLAQTKGNKSEAARLLGVHRGTVINRMRKYGVDLQKVVRT